MKLPTLPKRFWIICSTLLVIGSLFAYYFLVYVEGREKKLRQDKYRALERLGENMLQTRQNYHKAIGTSWLRTRLVIDKRRRQYAEEQKRFRASRREQSDLLETSLDRIDKLVKEDRIREKLIDLKEEIEDTASHSSTAFWNKYRDTLRNKISDDVRGNLPRVRYDGYFDKTQCDSLVHKNFNRIYFSYPGRNANRSGVFSIETGDFLALRPDQFDDFFIVKDFDEQGHEETEGEGTNANVVFQTLENHVSLASIDSFMVREKGLLTNHVKEIMLSDTKYKLFVHAIRFSEGENWLLCGLVETENFNSQIRAVDPLWIASAILVVLFLIIAMPILKLRIMNTYERLSIANVWFTGLSVVCGSAVLFIIIWSGSHNLQSIARVDKDLDTLSGQVKQRFERELHDIRDQLDDLNKNLSVPLIAMFKKDTIVYGDFFRQGSRNDNAYSDIQKYKQKYDSLKYPYFNYLLWIDSLGYPSITLTTKPVGPDFKMPNLSERKYVSRALHDSLWYLPSLEGTKPYSSFALQSIQSWTDYRPEAGFGIALDSSRAPFKVLAMATRLHSVMDPVLPLGYGFCIIDDSGEVWFHSNTLKNHQENIFHEIKNPDKLTAAVKGRAKTSFSTEYAGGRNRMSVQPLGNLPLHLVMFHDKDYQRTPMVLTLSLAFSMMIILFLIQGGQMLLLFACEFQSGKLISHRFFLKTLQPDPGHSSMYQNGVGAQIVLLIICLALYVRGDFATVFGFITLPVMLMAFHQILYHKKLKRPVILFLIFSGVTIFLLNVLTFHWLSDEEEQLVVGQQLIFAFVLFLFLPERKTKRRRTINEVLAQKPVEDAETRELQKVKSLLDIKGFGQTLTKWFERARKKLKYPNSYYTYLVLWLILISILPVAYFYKMAQWQESLLWAKYEQLQAREATLKRTKLVDEEVRFLHDIPTTYPHAVGSYLPRQDSIISTSCNTNGDIFQGLLFEAWPRLQDPFNISSAASFTMADDKKWTWTKSMDKVQIEYDSKDGPSPKKVYYTSSYGNFKPFGGEYGFWFFLLTVLSFFMLVKMIQFSTKYIFGIGMLPQYKMLSDNELKGIMTKSNRVYIAGLPGSGKSELFDRPFEDGVMPNFEMGINDHESNQHKLQAIQARIKDKPDKKIVILSSVQPSAILEVYRKRICDGGHEDDKANKPDNKLEDYKIALRKWKNVLGGFEVYYKSIRPVVTMEFTKNEVKNDELNSCYYLQSLAQNNKKVLGIDKLNNEDFIINVEEIAEPYYNALWNSFSQEEKLLLFDLAHGGYVNLKNQRCLRILMQKGVISTKDHSLDIMNKSFTKFILGVFREDEELEIAKKVRSKGAWQNIQLVLVLTLISIVVFIALAQKELMSDLNAFVVAITGAVGLLSKFGGWFGSGKKE